ncbi:hypothetical protein A9C19_14845 [Bacillus weihaiensis]|uniref:Uncharacterized protein n=1 Tax=Bacillus weihaiensis TaxID=1547283 RepID=A0A1L3MUA5_9BACI|nr:hypothetical protein A9C19_14845 [Bacillus weihaiensis]
MIVIQIILMVNSFLLFEHIKREILTTTKDDHMSETHKRYPGANFANNLTNEVIQGEDSSNNKMSLS